MTEEKSLKEKLIAETKTYLMVALYLAILLGTFINYRRLIAREYSASYLEWGFCLVEAMILAKLVIIGRVLKVGERFHNRPLIVPTLYKTFCFSIFVLLFCILEHVVTGLIHKEHAAQIGERLLSQGKWEILSRLLILVTAFVPLFAAWEIGAILGEGRLYELFFRPRKNDDIGRT